MADNRSPVEYRPDDFVLVQENVRISDKKLDTKPTTFFKDAIKRFAKNKSSVTAAIILAILILLAIIVPMVSDKNITVVSSKERFLAPKLFEAGTGFWDGTRSYKHIVYDPVNEVPALSEKNSIEAIKASLIKLKVYDEPELIDSRSQYGTGGAIVVETDVDFAGRDIYMTSKNTRFSATGNYMLEIEFSKDTKIGENIVDLMPEDGDQMPEDGDQIPEDGDQMPEDGDQMPEDGDQLQEETLEDQEADANAKLGEYRVSLKYGETDEERLIIRDFGTDFSDIKFNISEALAEAGLNNVNGSIVFDVKSADGGRRYILVEKVVLSADENVSNAEDLAAISFTDATKMINIADKNDMSYWACSGRKGIHDSIVYYCDYTIDTYMLVYGDADVVTYSKADLQKMIDDGWCTYDYKVGPESFVRLSDECPIDEVVSQKVLGVTKKLSSVDTRGWNYRKLGYKTMPKFILGTDASGFDLFKRSFAGLRTSLLLGVCTAAFCFTFGLLWGSISGYFGGNVDLAMERFCEILGGVPWIVVMTLCILHFGNSFGVFLLALCLTGWMSTAQRTRTQFYRFKGREYVLASRTLGAKDMRLIFKHILPNSMGTIITSSVLMIPTVIFSEATLAYLNLGLQGKQAFGVMMAANQQYLGIYPNLVIFPAIIIALMMISFNLFGNGLRDAFNPSLKGSD